MFIFRFSVVKSNLRILAPVISSNLPESEKSGEECSNKEKKDGEVDFPHSDVLLRGNRNYLNITGGCKLTT